MGNPHAMLNAKHAERVARVLRERQLRDLAPELLQNLVIEYERVCDLFCKQPDRCEAYRRAVEVLSTNQGE